MKKAFAFLFIISHIVVVTGQNKSLFDSYLSNFKSIQTGIPTRSDFSLGSSKAITQDFVEQFVTSTPDCGCEKEGVAYLYAFKIEEDNFIVALVSKVCEMVLSGETPYYDEKLLLVYSPNGRLIDSMSISREQAYHFYNYGGTWRPFNLQVKHASAIPDDVIRESPPYPCKYDTYQYTITPEGKIVKKQLHKAEQGMVIWKDEQVGMEIVQDSNLHIYNAHVALREKNATFEQYISNFEPCKAEAIDKACFQVREAIPGYFIKRFITGTSDCGCLNEGLWYRYMFTIEKGDFIIAFVAKSCDIPSPSGSYPYTDYILIVYSPKGEVIDSEIVSREGDLWECNHCGTVEPFVLTVEQANIPEKVLEKSKRYPFPCEISTSEYRVSKEGRIQQTVISERKGTIVWDKKNNRSSIVKKIDEKE